MNQIKLNAHIIVDGLSLESVTLRRPKVRDRLMVERQGKTDAEKEVALIANLTALPVERIEELDLADYARIQEVLQDFLLPSVPTT